MTKLVVHCGKLIDINVFSNNHPVSLMDKTVNFQSKGRGFDPQQKLAFFFWCFFMRYDEVCVSICYIQIYINSASNRCKFIDSFLPSKTGLNRHSLTSFGFCGGR